MVLSALRFDYEQTAGQIQLNVLVMQLQSLFFIVNVVPYCFHVN